MKLYATKRKKGSKKAEKAVIPRIYLDNASTTPPSPAVQSAMEPFFSDSFGNPSSISSEGVVARRAVESARASIARLLGALPDEIVFTSGGTEGNNLAIFGIANAYPEGSFVTSSIEHPSVLEPMRVLGEASRKIVQIPVEKNGIFDMNLAKRAIGPDTLLVSVMYANNEIGTIQPIHEIAKMIRRERKNRDLKDPFGMRPPFLHVDACQAPGFLPIDLARIGVDLATFSSQKFYGPKGVGFLYVRRGIMIRPLMYGGGHEAGIRPGTENVAGIVGMAGAFEDAEKKRDKEVRRLSVLRDWFIETILKDISGTRLNGDPALRLANNVNISFGGIESELLVLDLDAKGVAVSSGSACGTREALPSAVICALGATADYAKTAVRFTFGRHTTKADLKRVLSILKDSIIRHRRFSAV